MKHQNLRSTKRCRCAYLVLTAIVFASSTGAWAWENPFENPYTNGPLDICDQGTFHVGGVPKITPYADSNEIGVPQQNIIGQMYVEFQIPKKRRQWPVIMVHGGGYSGSCLSSTPQATEGWDSYALRNNLATFIVDQAGRGRSTFDNSILDRGESYQQREPNSKRVTRDKRRRPLDELARPPSPGHVYPHWPADKARRSG